jgi:hypothetical protein
MTSSQLTPLQLISSTLARDVHPVDFGTSLQYLNLNPGSGIFPALDAVHFLNKDLDPDPQRRIDYTHFPSYMACTVGYLTS